MTARILSLVLLVLLLLLLPMPMGITDNDDKGDHLGGAAAAGGGGGAADRVGVEFARLHNKARDLTDVVYNVSGQEYVGIIRVEQGVIGGSCLSQILLPPYEDENREGMI